MLRCFQRAGLRYGGINSLLFHFGHAIQISLVSRIIYKRLTLSLLASDVNGPEAFSTGLLQPTANAIVVCRLRAFASAPNAELGDLVSDVHRIHESTYTGAVDSVLVV